MRLPWKQVHLIAIREALRAHQELGTDLTRQIDPFAALEASGVLPMRDRLDGLAGLYIPGNPLDGTVAGALINVAHPLSKQRYTAAHELSHHRRDRHLALDRDTEWLHRGSSNAPDHERIAEAFAAWFLMPRVLVEHFVTLLGCNLKELTSVQAYELSLELGTSYVATVRHLKDMTFISPSQRDSLLGQEPQSIKQQTGAADALADPWKDVWLLGAAHGAGTVITKQGDALVFELPENPSSGYVWQPMMVPAGLEFVRQEYRPRQPAALGGQGDHRFIFRVTSSGQAQVAFEMRRPWQLGAPVATMAIAFTAAPKPTSGLVQPRQLISAGI